jgi:hypothetical protein
MNKEMVLDYLTSTPLKDLGDEFSVLTSRVYANRQANKGYVPLEIFEQCVGLGGMSVSVQIVNAVMDADGKHIGFALKQRDASEAGEGWASLYHSTCTTGRLPDTPESALERDTKEAFGHASPGKKPGFLGVTIHDEPERCSSCLTVMHLRTVTEKEVSAFVGRWRIFSEADVRHHHEDIVDHNWYLLEWVLDFDRPKFANVRGGWWPGKDRGIENAE